MKVNETFLKAKTPKENANALIVAMRKYNGSDALRKYMYLCIDQKIKYSDKRETVFVETDTDIRFDNYSGYPEHSAKKEPRYVCFHIYVHDNNHARTFLNAIKKDSDVSFKVLAWNGSEWSRKHNLVCHRLYGYVDNNEYLLSEYIGEDNTATPVRENILYVR